MWWRKKKDAKRAEASRPPTKPSEQPASGATASWPEENALGDSAKGAAVGGLLGGAGGAAVGGLAGLLGGSSKDDKDSFW